MGSLLTRVADRPQPQRGPTRLGPATPSLPFVLPRTCIEDAEVKWPGVSVVDRGEPEVSRSEWHGDGTAGEDDRVSHLAAVAPSSRDR
jgi:hypothetical protein